MFFDKFFKKSSSGQKDFVLTQSHEIDDRDYVVPLTTAWIVGEDGRLFPFIGDPDYLPDELRIRPEQYSSSLYADGELVEHLEGDKED